MASNKGPAAAEKDLELGHYTVDGTTAPSTGGLATPDRNQGQLVSRASSSDDPKDLRERKRQWDGWVEVVCNVIGTFLFIPGSLGWILGLTNPGCIIFGLACLCCGIACTIYSVKFYKVGKLHENFALLQQAAGCYLFVVGCGLFTITDATWQLTALVLFLISSFLFLSGTSLTQFCMRAWVGPLSPLLPGTYWEIIPPYLGNTLGSVFFVVGSWLLFYPWGQLAGAWMYEIGSVIFFFASYGDGTTWWNMGFAKTDAKTLEENYLCTKFV